MSVGSGPASFQNLIEQILIHLPGPMGIRIGKRGFIRGLSQPKMVHLPQTTSQTTADLPDTLGLRQLAEKHGNKLLPAAISLGMSIGLMHLNQLEKFSTIDQRKQLTEDARYSYHVPVLLVSDCVSLKPFCPLGGLFSISFHKNYFGQECKYIV